jgi:hypothetical protein
MIEHFSTKDRETIEFLGRRVNCDLSRDAAFRAVKKEMQSSVDHHNGELEYDNVVANQNRKFKCDDTEAQALAVGCLYGWDLVERGVVRRIVRNSPTELAAALSLNARLEWLTLCAPGRPLTDRDDDAWHIMSALAGSDINAAVAFFGTRSRPLKRRNCPATLLYNGLRSIITDQTQRGLLEELEYSGAPLPIRALHSTLLGILTDDAELVADGISKTLKKFKQLKTYGAAPLKHETLISLHAHGLAELAFWKSPNLLQQFDTSAGLPWDAKYYKLLRRKGRSLAFLDLSSHSKLLSRWINTLQPPAWWQKKSQ